MTEKKTTKKKIESVPVPRTDEELGEILKELMIVMPEGASLRETYTEYLKNKLRKVNANVHRFQYMKKNCDVQLKKRYDIQKELGIKKAKRLYSYTDERLVEDNGVEYRDVYVAFVPSTIPSKAKVRKKDWRKFLTPKDVDEYVYIK